MIRKGSHKSEEYFGSQHRFEHWYCDNMVYFITARCCGGTHAFSSETCKLIFWERFEHYTQKHGFVPFVTSLLSKHYHTLGYLRKGKDLPLMMRGIHGSVAKLVNDQRTDRLVPFWVDTGHQNYFDGCIRNETQCRRAYRYVLTQCNRHGISANPEDYPHTQQRVAMEPAMRRAKELRAFLQACRIRGYSK